VLLLAGIAADKAYFVTVHTFKRHELCSKVISVYRFLGTVADGTW